MKTPLIFNVQKFSTHDGPGVRSTIFFKGCPIHCEWCHNPESQSYKVETMVNKDGEEDIVGETYEIKEIVNLVKKDQLFYDQSGGGVTFSGGEVLAQSMPYVLELAKELNRLGISIAIDTCGVVPQKNIEAILPYADLFLYDLKFIDSQLHQIHTGVPNHLVLENLKYLGQQHARIDLRLIIIGGLNDADETAIDIIQWLKEEHIAIEAVSLLPYHDFGRDKYNKLERDCTQNFEKPTDERIKKLKEIYENEGYAVKIGG